MIDLEPEDKRPKRHGWAPGGYICTCGLCGKRFQGDKRARNCAPCAYTLPEVADELKVMNGVADELGTIIAEQTRRIRSLEAMCRAAGYSREQIEAGTPYIEVMGS